MSFVPVNFSSLLGPDQRMQIEWELKNTTNLGDFETLLSFLKDLNKTVYQPSLNILVRECEAQGAKEFLSNLASLDLSHCSLESLPEGIGLLVKLEELKLIGNKLGDLPKSIVSLKTLRKLELERNRFKTVPQPVIDRAKQAIESHAHFELYLRDNPMGTVPKEIKSVVRSMPYFDSVFH